MILRPPIFDASPTITAGFTTRAFSPEAESTKKARKRIARQEGFDQVVSVGQVHGADVAVVTEPGHIPDCDGLVTDQAGMLLTVVGADCALVLLADEASGVLGACHSGWRGTVANITAKTIREMQTLGADPARMAAYVSPCISAEAFEVGEEVASQFDAATVKRRQEWEKPHVDLPAAIKRQLEKEGIQNIEVSNACTASDTSRFYSYRAEGGTEGRMLGFIGRQP